MAAILGRENYHEASIHFQVHGSTTSNLPEVTSQISNIPELYRNYNTTTFHPVLFKRSGSHITEIKDLKIFTQHLDFPVDWVWEHTILSISLRGILDIFSSRMGLGASHLIKQWILLLTTYPPCWAIRWCPLVPACLIPAGGVWEQLISWSNEYSSSPHLHPVGLSDDIP